MNTYNFFRVLRGLVILGTLMLVACANQGVTRSGFLDHYEQLNKVEHTNGLQYSNAAAPIQKAIFIDAIEVRLPPSQVAAVSPKLVEQARIDYRQALIDAFSTHFQVLSGPPTVDALRVRAAITGLKPANPKLNVAVFLVLGPVSNGGASTEAEVLDPISGQRLAALATYTNGNLFKGGMGGYFDPLGHIRKAFAEHAEQLKKLVLNTSSSRSQRSN